MIGEVLEASPKRNAFECGVGLLNQQSDKLAFHFCRSKMIDRVLDREDEPGCTICVEYRREQNVVGPSKFPSSIAFRPQRPAAGP